MLSRCNGPQGIRMCECRDIQDEPHHAFRMCECRDIPDEPHHAFRMCHHMLKWSLLFKTNHFSYV